MNSFQQLIQIFTNVIDDFSQNLNNLFVHPGNDDDEILTNNSSIINTNGNSEDRNNVFIEISQSYQEAVPGYKNTITIPNCFSNDVESFLSNPSIYLDQITEEEFTDPYFLLPDGNLATREFIARDIIAFGNPTIGNKPLIDFAFNNFLVNNSQKLDLSQETINLYKGKISQQKSLLQEKYSDLVKMSELSFEKKEEFKNKISAFFNACLKYGSKNSVGQYLSFHHLFQKELDELIRDDASANITIGESDTASVCSSEDISDDASANITIGESDTASNVSKEDLSSVSYLGDDYENNARELSIEDSSVISSGINNLIESVESGTNSLIENNKQLIGTDIADSLKTFVSGTSKDTRKIITVASRSVNDIIRAFNDNTDFEQGPSSRPSTNNSFVHQMKTMFEQLQTCNRN